jgi:biotin carboxyl carrier protein
VIEAMKMETVITAATDGAVIHIELPVGSLVNTNDFVMEMG